MRSPSSLSSSRATSTSLLSISPTLRRYQRLLFVQPALLERGRPVILCEDTQWTETNTQNGRRHKRDLFIWQKRPIYMAKETHLHGKRDLFTWHCVKTHNGRRHKRDLFIRQKGPIYMAKETYSHGKRDLFTWQKRPIHMALCEDTQWTENNTLNGLQDAKCTETRRRVLKRGHACKRTCTAWG